MNLAPPIVLCCSGHDPTGGAGIQADIETIRALGAHPATLVTALTEQDSENVLAVHPVSVGILRAQAKTLLTDLRIAAIKIGLLGSAEVARWLVDVCAQHPQVPVIFDPILRAGGGSELVDAEIETVIRDELLAGVTVATPNRSEALRLVGSDEPHQAAAKLQQFGARWVLITGGDGHSAEVENHLYGPDADATISPRRWCWPRLEGAFHGSGCTLAAAIAACVAQGDAVPQACERAQRFTHATLERAVTLGRGQRFPVR